MFSHCFGLLGKPCESEPAPRWDLPGSPPAHHVGRIIVPRGRRLLLRPHRGEGKNQTSGFIFNLGLSEKPSWSMDHLSDGFAELGALSRTEGSLK